MMIVEERNALTILDNVYGSLVKTQHSLEEWEQQQIHAKEHEMAQLVDFTGGFLQEREQLLTAELSDQEAIHQQLKVEFYQYITSAVNLSRHHLWVIDVAEQRLIHPNLASPELMAFLSDDQPQSLRNQRLQSEVKAIIHLTKTRNEGFWHSEEQENQAKDLPIHLSYFRHFPHWQLTLVGSQPIDDIVQEMSRREAELKSQFRAQLNQKRIGQTGYLYVLDSNMDMIIHPDARLEGANVGKMLNPLSKAPLAEELINAAKSGRNKLIYQWNSPGDPDNFNYYKIAWIKYFADFDWYILTSVYLDELQASANQLSQRIIIVTLISLLIALSVGYMLLRRLTEPLAQLAHNARKVAEGDFDAKNHIVRDDEIGTLATVFNIMVDRLKDQIDHLEYRVKERTEELSHSVKKLKLHNQEIEHLNQLSERLQRCRHPQELYLTLNNYMGGLFPEYTGCLLIVPELQESDQLFFAPQQALLLRAACWGEPSQFPEQLEINDCYAVDQGKTINHSTKTPTTPCPCPGTTDSQRLCLPLSSHEQLLGMLLLDMPDPEIPGAKDNEQRGEQINDLQRLAESIASQLSLTINNFSLRESLRRQSIQDVLTGLYNRRYLEDHLPNEVERARRKARDISIVLLDVDHFKILNDDYGHDVGDQVLKKLGEIITRQIRSTDMACRYGGEEILLIMPETSTETALARAENLRQMIDESLTVTVEATGIARITVSMGVATYPQHAMTTEALVKAADEALYAAKNAGRNRVVVAGEAEH